MPTCDSRDNGWSKTTNSSSESVNSTTHLSSSSSSSSLTFSCDEVASSTARCKGGATLGTPFGIGMVARVPSSISPVTRKPGVATLIRCSWGSFALITHLGAWKLLDIGVLPNIKWTALSWPSEWTKTSAFRILSKHS